MPRKELKLSDAQERLLHRVRRSTTVQVERHEIQSARILDQLGFVTYNDKERICRPRTWGAAILPKDATPSTSIRSAALSGRAFNALWRLGATTVKDVATISRARYAYARGVGAKTCAEIDLLVAEARALVMVREGNVAPVPSAAPAKGAKPAPPKKRRAELRRLLLEVIDILCPEEDGKEA